MVNYAANFSHIFVIVGDNDVNTESVEFILNRFNEFSDAVWPSKVKFCGHMRRKDLNSDLVASNNSFLSEQLGLNYRSTKLIKRKDFSDDTPFHFSRDGEGYRHLAALILSVFREFDNFW